MGPPRSRFCLRLQPGCEDEWLAWLGEAGFSDAFSQRDYPHGLLADEVDLSPREVTLVVTVDADRVHDLLRCIQEAGALGWMGGEPPIEVLPPPGAEESDPESLWQSQWRPFRCAGFAIHAEFVTRAEIALKPSDLPLVLAVGSAFGSGSHPTTRMALRALRRIWHQEQPARWLDVGTGSGILAVAAARLGARRVYAMDPEAPSPLQALRMARANGVQDRVTAWRGGFESARGTFPAVVANLFADLLEERAAELAALVEPGGCIFTGGIVDRRWDLTRERLLAAGLEPAPLGAPWPDARGRWRAAIWRRPRSGNDEK